jgi:hypothetical protein
LKMMQQPPVGQPLITEEPEGPEAVAPEDGSPVSEAVETVDVEVLDQNGKEII